MCSEMSCQQSISFSNLVGSSNLNLLCTLLYTVSPVAADEVTERVDSVGDSEEGESSSVGSSVKTSSEDSEEEETDPRVKEEVGCRNDGIFNSIEVCD